MLRIPFKEIVHFKMKILSSYTHPQVVSNLYGFLSQRKKFSRIAVNKIAVKLLPIEVNRSS